jgi:hypothetical protein
MVASILRVEDEPPVYFIGEDGVETAHDIKEILILTGVEQCSDALYDERKSICDSCDKLMGGELCDVDRLLIRVENRVQDKRCPLSKW